MPRRGVAPGDEARDDEPFGGCGIDQRLAGRRAGAWGQAAAFSFYPTKNLGAYGDGGAVTSNDAGVIERVKELRQGGHPSAMKGRVAGRN